MKGIIEQEMFDCVPEIDFNIGYRYFIGNMDNYAQALLSILKSIKSKLPLLDSMNYSKEYEGLRTITQTLRRMLTNVGAVTLAEDTYQLETYVLNGDTEHLQEKLPEYIEGLYVFSEHLEQLMKQMEKGVAKPQEERNSFFNYDFTKTKESIKRSNDLLGRKII